MTRPRHPLQRLDETEQEFVLRLVLASGSLKELATSYGVSYPTIRARLDRLIEKLEDLVAERPRDPLADKLADLVSGGVIAPRTAKELLKLHRAALEES
ncbi:MAG: hypothetical protein CMJ83_18490 [Planctomycetes bacterium]|nr:hypothetical protein [Planctomycetota bacterium]